MLEIGAALDAPINFGHAATDPMVAELMTTGRDVVWFLAEQLDAYDFFMETQSIGLATGIVYTPGELMADPHFVDRGFPAAVEHPEGQVTGDATARMFRGTGTSQSAAVVSGAGRRLIDTRPDSTLGTGQNTVGGTVPTRLVWAYHAILTDGMP